MEWSRYNIIVQGNKEDVIIYNSFSNALIVLKNNEFHKYQTKLPTTGTLVENGIIVHNQKEQDLLLKYRFTKYKFNNRIPTFYIAPTMDCNLSCFYCFEGNNKKKEYISNETENNIIQYIKSFHNNRIYIIWFGGEPTLNINPIVRIYNELRNSGIEIESSMITNGTLLSTSNLRKLVSINLKHIQITIDGTKEQHDKRRFYKNGKGTFDSIISNITTLIRETNINLTIQVTTDKNNVYAYSDICALMNEQFGKEIMQERITVGVNFVQNRTDDPILAQCTFNSQKKANFYLENHLKADKKTQIEFLFPRLAGPCMYSSIDTIAVDSGGYLYKCIEHIGDISQSVGNINTKKIDNYKFVKAVLCTDPFEDKNCKHCNILPICGGGCPLDRIKRQEEGADINLCPMYKGNIEKIIKRVYELQN